MATNINDIIVENTLSANTLTATTIFLGNSDINSLFAPNVMGGYLPISGGTVTGDTSFTGNLSASTLISGSTNLYSIFQTIGAAGTQTAIQSGTNTYTGGTASLPTVNVSALTINTLVVSGATQLGLTTSSSFSGGTISGGTLFSGSTNLYDIFATSSSGNQTFVQPGTNTYTGGTASLPTINVSALTINTLIASGSSQLGTTTASSFSGGTVSGGTFYSGSTTLANIMNTVTLATLLSGYATAGSGTTSGLTSSNTVLTAFQSLERLIKNNDIQHISASTSTTTTSTSYTDLTGMSAQTKDLAQSGVYFIIFNASVQNSTNGRFIGAQINIDGNAVTAGTSSVNSVVSNAGRRAQLTCTAVATIPRDKIVKIQWRTESNTATVFERSLTIIGIPSNYIL